MKRILKNILFSILTIIIFLVISEVACRTYESIKTDCKQDIEEEPYIKKFPLLYWEPMPNVTWKDLNAFDTKFHINSLGFRGKEFQIKKPKNTFRIIALGDSCTFGYGASDDERTYPMLLQSKLNDRLNNKKYEVINAGIPGMVSFQALIRLEAELIDLDPDLLIIFLGWDDMGYSLFEGFFQNIPGGWLVTKNLPESELKETFLTKTKTQIIKENLQKYSGLFRRLERTIYKIQKKQRKLSGKDEVDIDELIKKHEEMPERDNPGGLRQYIRNMQHIFLITRNHNIKTFVLSWPTLLSENMTYEEKLRMKPNLGGWNSFSGSYKMYRNYQQAIEKISKQNNILFFDIAEYFKVDTDTKLQLFKDMGHLTDKGCDLFAEKLFDALIDLRILDRK